jgi:hypothetical protein
MGGNAMKHVGVERKSAADYHAITGEVLAMLARLFPASRSAPIQAYGQKESFGDSDILIASDQLPPDWLEIVKRACQPQDLFDNGGVVSFDFRGMQIDLIKSPEDEFAFAHTYFAYNDLGNLMGRIAHKMGFKYGHDGLWKLLRDKDQVFAEILVTRDVARTFALLGYDHARFLQGYDTLDDVFTFAASTPYFHRQIYQLDNRNAKSRVRDAKRPSYTAFLAWLDDKPELDRYTWSAWNGGLHSAERDAERSHWETHVFQEAFPEARPRYEQALAEHAAAKQARRVWNGDIVGRLTGLTGKALGECMAACKTRFLATPAAAQHSFDTWIVTQREDQIAAYLQSTLQAITTP